VVRWGWGGWWEWEVSGDGDGGVWGAECVVRDGVDGVGLDGMGKWELVVYCENTWISS